MDKNKLFKYCFGIEAEHMSENVILTPFIHLNKFKKYCNEIENFKGMMYSGFFSKGKKGNFSIINCGIGDRLSGDAVLLLGHAGIKNLIFLGACGGLNDFDIGDIVICEEALDGEGFSRYYQESFRIHEILKEVNVERSSPVYVEEVWEYFNRKMNNGSVKKGKIFTIGSILAETKENILLLEKNGFNGIEMEMSAVSRAANISGITSTGVLIVSDLPGKKHLWQYPWQEKQNIFQQRFDDMIRLSVEIF